MCQRIHKIWVISEFHINSSHRHVVTYHILVNKIKTRYPALYEFLKDKDMVDQDDIIRRKIVDNNEHYSEIMEELNVLEKTQTDGYKHRVMSTKVIYITY